MKPFDSPLLLALATLLALPASAPAQQSTLYKCTDGSGTVLYTNQKGAKKDCTVISVMLPPAPRNDGAAAGAAPKRNGTATPSPADFPKVSDNEQKSRDGDRRAILERELDAERGNIEKARQSLATNPPPAADKAQALNDTIKLHERNVEALNKELAKLK